MVLDGIFDIFAWIFGPLLSLDPMPHNPILTIFIIATIIAFFTTLANKILVNQDEMLSTKEEMEKFQKK